MRAALLRLAPHGDHELLNAEDITCLKTTKSPRGTISTIRATDRQKYLMYRSPERAFPASSTQLNHTPGMNPCCFRLLPFDSEKIARRPNSFEFLLLLLLQIRYKFRAVFFFIPKYETGKKHET
jgi:hypothetical protein